MNEKKDMLKSASVMSTNKWEVSRKGQHFELGIAENNLFLALGAVGLSDSLFGHRLFPVGTLYDPFISRGLDALNYSIYSGARFILASTPSGIALAPEGGIQSEAQLSTHCRCTPIDIHAIDWNRSTRVDVL